MYMGSQKFMNGYLGIHTDGLNLPMLLFMLIRLKFGPNESYYCGAVWLWGCRTMTGSSHHGGIMGGWYEGQFPVTQSSKITK